MSSVSVEQHDSVVLLSIDHPPANAIGVELLDELLQALGAAATDPPPALVLAGRPGFFSAGVDLKAVPGYTPEQHRQMVAGINQMVLTSYALPCPVVAAITGHAIAGGLVLALCADYRIASSAGRYGLTEVKVGVPYPRAAIGVVKAELPAHTARQLALGNELITADECVRLGVFDEAKEPERVAPRALELAATLADMPADVYARTKCELRDASLEAMRAAARDDPLLEAWVPGS